jgi:hypothetical protein
MVSHVTTGQPIGAARAVYEHVLSHLIRRINDTRGETQPFGHAYFTELLPADVYHSLLDTFPDPATYDGTAERHYRGEVGGFVRSQFPLSLSGLDRLSAASRELWRGVAAALTATDVKRAVYAKLAPDLAFRFGIAADQVPDLAGYSRPTLYRETEGFEIPPHPDTRRKVVTMHIYLPADHTQIGLGTALYKRHPLALPFGDWRRRFAKVKQFEFRPNSGYAFVVNNTLTKRSWHGRERLPEGAGVRNTLLNTYYQTPLEGYINYLPGADVTAEPVRRAA